MQRWISNINGASPGYKFSSDWQAFCEFSDSLLCLTVQENWQLQPDVSEQLPILFCLKWWTLQYAPAAAAFIGALVAGILASMIKKMLRDFQEYL